MALDFPSSPTTGQAFNSYVFDGEKWTLPTNSSQDFVRYGVQTLSAGQKTQAITNLGLDVPVFYGYIGGLSLSTAGGSAIFGVSIGACTDSTAVDFMKLTSAYTKTTGSWAVGTSNGALDTGTIAASTWYHVFVIKRLDTGVVDILVSLSPTSPTMPTNYTLKRRIGSMYTVAGPVWKKFLQTSDQFMWDVPSPDVNNVANTTTGTLRSLLVPTGIQVLAFGSAAVSTADNNMIITSPNQTDTAAANTAGQFRNGGTNAVQSPMWAIQTNTSGQLRFRQDSSSGVHFFNTWGWYDDRGTI